MKKRLLSVLCAAAAVCMTVQPVSAEETAWMTDGETEDGYYYAEFAEDQQGTHRLTLGDYGTFTCEWDGIFNYRAEVGKRFQQYDSFAGIGNLEFTYSGKINIKGNCYYGVHGSFGSDMPQVYIVEGWGSWRPPGGQGMIGKRTANGKTYDYYEGTYYANPAADSSEIVRAVFAVAESSGITQNQECRIIASTDFTRHIRNLAELDSDYSELFNAKLEYAALFADGYGGRAADSSCKLSVDKMNTYVTWSPDPVPTVTDKRIAADQNGVFFREDYETGIGNAGQYGESTTIDVMPHYHVDGAQSLSVTDRSDSREGVAYRLDDYAIIPDTSYSFQTALMQEAENEVTFRLIMQYRDDSGLLQYQALETVKAKRGEWVILRCPDFQVPSDGSKKIYVKNAKLLIETPDSIADYYLDSACLSKAGALPEISLADCVPPLPEETGGIAPPVPKDTPEYDPDGDGMKDLFGQYFRVGGIISDQYLKTDAAKDSVKKHFNSLSCKYGLDPLYTIKAVNGTDVTVDISRAASVLTFAEQNGIPVRGNSFFTIGTDQLLPEEMLLNINAQECDARIESLMKNTFSELKFQHPNLKLYSYDVCTHVTGGSSEGGFYIPGRNQWSSIYGEGNDAYIVQAFKNARKYAPRITKLYLCDDQSWKMAEDAELEVLVKKIMQEGDYIDGVSLKAAVGRETDLTAYESWLKKLSALGMDIQFAEIGVHDVGDYSGAFMIQAWKQFLAMAADCADEISCVTLGKPAVTMPIFDEGPTTLFNINSETGELTPVWAFSEITDMMKARKDQTGDANCDGVVDVSDAVLVMRYAVADREAVISEQGLKNSDTDGDGNVSDSDATMILLHIAKKINLIK
ncbi:MAG: endo-1,4-beta-xylanase [Oscillospiraceae bacterium]|nr:endo-1,4-beta-xylanase [Oscillospiraceae bacterium]